MLNLCYLAVFSEKMLSGCIRVSKLDGSQNSDLRGDALVEAAVDKNRIYHGIASGKDYGRPGLTQCLKALRPGNTLVVWKLDRQGRDLESLVTTIDELRQKNVGFEVLTGQGARIGTATPMDD